MTKVDSLQQSTTLSSVVRPKWISKVSPQIGYGDYLAVCNRYHSSELHESGWNNYCREVHSRNRQDVPKTMITTTSISQSKSVILCFTTTLGHIFQRSLDYEALDHPSYSPDLSSTDYRFFQKIDKFLF